MNIHYLDTKVLSFDPTHAQSEGGREGFALWNLANLFLVAVSGLAALGFVDPIGPHFTFYTVEPKGQEPLGHKNPTNSSGTQCHPTLEAQESYCDQGPHQLAYFHPCL